MLIVMLVDKTDYTFNQERYKSSIRRTHFHKYEIVNLYLFNKSMSEISGRTIMQ